MTDHPATPGSDASPGWPCRHCGHGEQAEAAYCRLCGEPRESGPRATIARWLRTLRLLLCRPGRLTAEYAGVLRRASVAPLSLFFAANLVFFVAQSLSGLSVLSVPLDTHLQGQWYSGRAAAVVAERVQAHGAEPQRWMDGFEWRQQNFAKASVIAMVPPVAAASTVLFAARLPFALHAVWALHFFAFALLTLSALFPLLGGLVRLAASAGVIVTPGQIDLMASYFELLGLGLYAYLSAGRAFGGPAWRRAGSAGLIMLVLYASLLMHRVAVFFVTAWLV